MNPTDVAAEWVEHLHRWIGSWPHRVWVATGEPPLAIAEAGNYVAEPLPTMALGTSRPSRYRTPEALYLVREAVPGIVVGLCVPANRSHPLLDVVLELGAALYRSEWLLAQQHLSLQSMAHEVRAPLTLLSGYSEMLGHRGETEMSRLFLNEIDRVEGYLEEFLQAGRPMMLAPVELSDLVETVSDTYRPTCVSAGIAVTVSAARVIVLADRRKLETVLGNLFRNAIEAMPGGGDISIHVRAVPGGAEVTFTDSGPGIPEQIRRHLFEPYVSTKQQGHGLGLALSHDIMLRHSGLLELMPSEMGAAFRIWIPRGVPA
ncbi:MAG: sensor histidine kinase [Clostridia bacterium]